MKPIDIINSVPGWLMDCEVFALMRLAATVPPGGNIIEIGSLFGKSATCFALAAPTANVYCFDLWDDLYNAASDGVSRINTMSTFVSYTNKYSNIIPKKINGINDIKWDTDKIDMLFLDAAHTNPTDWEILTHFLPKLQPGSILCGHDYSGGLNLDQPTFPDVDENVHRLEGILNKKVTANASDGFVWSFIV